MGQGVTVHPTKHVFCACIFTPAFPFDTVMAHTEFVTHAPTILQASICDHI